MFWETELSQAVPPKVSVPRHVPEVELGGAKEKEMRQRPEKVLVSGRRYDEGSQLARRIGGR